MFRRLTSRLTSAANSSASGRDDNARQLEQMGFSTDAARHALSQCNDNVEAATEFLLSGANANASTDQALQAALVESLQSEEQRLYQQAQHLSLHHSTAGRPREAHAIGVQRITRTAAAQRAAAAAQQRVGPFPQHSNSDTLATHHPNVTIPLPLDRKSKEEQILRSADRLKSNSMAVDTLYKTLVTIQANPNVEKYRRIDTNNPGYQRSVAGAPGSTALLKSMGFQNEGAVLRLPREHVDSAVLYLGISALEQVKLKGEYKENKAMLKFEKDFAAIIVESNSSTEESIARSNYMQQLPSEPAAGTGALLQVKITNSTTYKRRFDGDDTLQDVLHWLGGHAPGILTNLIANEWSLMDLNRYPATPIDVTSNNRTLQAIGCWPSGKLEILPSSKT